MESNRQKPRAKRPSNGSSRVIPKARRWATACAWDGHELGDMEYVQVSAHERVCLFHHPQFQTWCQETSQQVYRAEGAEPGNSEKEDRLVPASS